MPIYTPDWLTAVGTIGATCVALMVALWGERVTHYWYRPELRLDVYVGRPASEAADITSITNTGVATNLGRAYFFRIVIRNTGNAAAKNVQVYLAGVKRLVSKVESDVDRFTPMNLKWSYIGKTTRDAILPDMFYFCDFIHIKNPGARLALGEDLSSVRPEESVIQLDVEAGTSNKGHLLEPGTYRLDLRLVAENFSSRTFIVEVWFPGVWFADQQEMFDKGIKIKL